MDYCGIFRCQLSNKCVQSIRIWWIIKLAEIPYVSEVAGRLVDVFDFIEIKFCYGQAEIIEFSVVCFTFCRAVLQKGCTKIPLLSQLHFSYRISLSPLLNSYLQFGSTS
jgi:hypothetical protein